MHKDEYIKTIVYNGHMINIGLDDYGQQYFLEYLDENNNIIQQGCGAYNENYEHEVEYLFGKPEDCPQYNTTEYCPDCFSHGYCGQCPYNPFVIEREKRLSKE